MNSITLLLSVFLDDGKSKGLAALKSLLCDADELKTVVFSECGRKSLKDRRAIEPLSGRFNLLEGTATVGGPNNPNKSALRFRYRPAPSSQTWNPIDLASVLDLVGEGHPKLTRTFMMLHNCQHPLPGLENLQLLCESCPTEQSIEQSIANCLSAYLPGLITGTAWAIADPVRFRQLTADEEWEVARTAALLNGLPSLRDEWHRYLVGAAAALPDTASVKRSVACGSVMIHELETPPWATES